MRDPDCVAFLQWALPHMGMRWPGFRKVRGQVCKRVSRRLRALGLVDGAAYRGYVEEHPDEWEVLDGLCRITISRFYRDRAVFDALRDHGFSDLRRTVLDRGERVVRCWCAGCASGEEPYSLSLAWSMNGSGPASGVAFRIVATDADPRLLERARAACYPPGALKELPAEWTQAAFADTKQGLCLDPSFRRPVTLAQQDIRREMPPGPFELVLCRNLVFTYFESSLQSELLRQLLLRIRDGGLLVLGGHEDLPPGGWPLERPYGAVPIYRRTGRALPRAS